MVALHPFQSVKALISQKSSFCVSWKNGVGDNIGLRKYVQIMHWRKISNLLDRNLLNFSISQLYVLEQTSLNKAEPGAHGRSHGVYGVYVVACQRCTS